MQAGCSLGNVPSDALVAREDNKHGPALVQLILQAAQTPQFAALFKGKNGEGSMFSSYTVGLQQTSYGQSAGTRLCADATSLA